MNKKKTTIDAEAAVAKLRPKSVESSDEEPDEDFVMIAGSTGDIDSQRKVKKRTSMK